MRGLIIFVSWLCEACSSFLLSRTFSKTNRRGNIRVDESSVASATPSFSSPSRQSSHQESRANLQVPPFLTLLLFSRFSILHPPFRRLQLRPSSASSVSISKGQQRPSRSLPHHSKLSFPISACFFIALFVRSHDISSASARQQQQQLQTQRTTRQT